MIFLKPKHNGFFEPISVLLVRSKNFTLVPNHLLACFNIRYRRVHKNFHPISLLIKNLSVFLWCHLDLSTFNVGCQPFDQESVPRFYPLNRNRQNFKQLKVECQGNAHLYVCMHTTPVPYAAAYTAWALGTQK